MNSTKNEQGIKELVKRGKAQLSTNPVLALAAFNMAALGANDPEALYYLGKMHYWGIGTTKDEQKAFGYLTTAAEAGHIEACNLLADCYGQGHSTKQDSDQCVKWLNEYARRRRESDPSFDKEIQHDEFFDDIDFELDDLLDEDGDLK